MAGILLIKQQEGGFVWGQYRFPVDQDYDNALEIINEFISGNSKVFLDISFKSEIIASQLRSYLKEFMSALKIIETVKARVAAQGEKFSNVLSWTCGPMVDPVKE